MWALKWTRRLFLRARSPSTTRRRGYRLQPVRNKMGFGIKKKENTLLSIAQIVQVVLHRARSQSVNSLSAGCNHRTQRHGTPLSLLRDDDFRVHSVERDNQLIGMPVTTFSCYFVFLRLLRVVQSPSFFLLPRWIILKQNKTKQKKEWIYRERHWQRVGSSL